MVKKDISKFAGAWNLTDQEADEMKQAIREMRSKTKKALLQRLQSY